MFRQFSIPSRSAAAGSGMRTRVSIMTRGCNTDGPRVTLGAHYYLFVIDSFFILVWSQYLLKKKK